ncbi:MAG: hypothetical protein F4Y47_13255 [Acidobacteriia bacterium]|nr:hypothetical protein [Terriglobia bacterium]MYG02382.1 hypothetical protein [Terriglobia bacterium]MYK08480.1 hypothetical protein [Terriglobia bacterium]
MSASNGPAKAYRDFHSLLEYRPAVFCHLGKIATRLGRSLQWGGDTEWLAADRGANDSVPRVFPRSRTPGHLAALGWVGLERRISQGRLRALPASVLMADTGLKAMDRRP